MIRPDGLDDREQERLRVEYFGLDRRQPDPDPLTPPEWSPQWREGYAAGWEDAPRHPEPPAVRRALAYGIVVGAILGLLAGILIANQAFAAPRGALVIPAASDGSPAGIEPDQGLLGAPRSGMPVEVLEADASRVDPAPAGGVGAPPSPALGGDGTQPLATSNRRQTDVTTVELGTAIESGIVAYALPSHGDRYLAIPSGPGHRVRICAGSGTVSRCLDRVSTDAGPDLSLQRAGRIADVSFVDFAWLCRCDPPTLGLLVATIEYAAGPTPPATGTEP